MVWRALQILISAFIIVALLATWLPVMMSLNFSPAVVYGVFLILLTILVWNNVKFNWLLLMSYDFTFEPQKISWMHVVQLSLIPIIIYFCANLSILYDTHLSMYDVSVRVPQWLWHGPPGWPSSFTIVRFEAGVYLLLFYILILSVAGNMFNSGWFTNREGATCKDTRIQLEVSVLADCIGRVRTATCLLENLHDCRARTLHINGI